VLKKWLKMGLSLFLLIYTCAISFMDPFDERSPKILSDGGKRSFLIFQVADFSHNALRLRLESLVDTGAWF
jgi:hypothetical protein